MSEDVFSQNLDILDGESVDLLQNAEHQDYLDDQSTINPSESIHQSRNQYYDSGDSDDYAESDN